MRFVACLLREVATLRRPVTAAAVLATFLAVVAPFGVDLDDATAGQVSAALVAVGVIAAYVERSLGR
jgi:hypothetical protein